MNTVSDNLREMASEIKNTLQTLLVEHSSIHKWNYDSSLFNSSGDSSWQKLDKEGLRVQSKILEEYRRFSAILRTLLLRQPKNSLKEFNDSNITILNAIEQQGSTWSKTSNEVFEKVSRGIDSITELIDNLHDNSESNVVYVPDTNALLYNPDLEKWHFDDVSHFSIALTPTVLSELDQQKVNHRVEDVRKKAEGLVKRIKEYRRRGKLTNGVTILKNKIDVFAVAVEPNFERTLPWLDSNNNDDRFLASTIEIMRLYSRSSVILITRDVNLQNKAEFALIPFDEPPS